VAVIANEAIVIANEVKQSLVVIANEAVVIANKVKQSPSRICIRLNPKARIASPLLIAAGLKCVISGL